MPSGPSITVFSPVCEEWHVLTQTAIELLALQRDGLRVRHWFYDDNCDARSTRLLVEVAEALKGTILPRSDHRTGVIRRTSGGKTHTWPEGSTERLARIKDAVIERFLADTDDEYLFLFDIDVGLHPRTLQHLVDLSMPIVAEVFWTRFHNRQPALPQVWSVHPGGYDLNLVLSMASMPDVYEVGGLGACTLVRRDVLESGVRFRRVKTVPFWGEDRHFSLRATARDWTLMADTTFPGVHVYRDSGIRLLAEWRASGYLRSFAQRELGQSWPSDVRRFLEPSAGVRVVRNLKTLASRTSGGRRQGSDR